MSTETKMQARIDIRPPQRLTTGAIAVISAYGLLLVVPFFLCVLVLSSFQLGLSAFVLPVLTLAATTFFLPVGFGNPYVKRFVRPFRPAAGQDQDSFIVQLTLSPRSNSGLRALLEDADDFGCLSFTESSLVFRGDSISASIPFEQIRQVQRRNIGWRGLFLCKQRIALELSGLPKVASLEFAERSSWLLPASRTTTERLYQRLSVAVPKPL